MSTRIANYQWQAEAYEAVDAPSVTASRLPTLAVGLLLLCSLLAAIWFVLIPATVVQMRFVADAAGPSGRAALAEAALRLAAASMASTSLDGECLTLTVSDRDPSKALKTAHSASVAILDMALSGGSAQPTAGVTPPPTSRATAPAPLPPLREERTRLRYALDAADARLAALSTALTGVARDLAAGMRLTVDRKPSRESLDKATVALADLQLQRIQLQSRYQDGFPAIAVLDGQIRAVRTFIADEAHKADMANRSAPDPGDPVLSAERDRLRAEQSLWLERRAATEAQLADISRAIAKEANTAPASALLPPASGVASQEPAPILMQAATSMTLGPDARLWAMPAAAAVGLALSLVAWFVPRRRSRAIQAELVLQRWEALLLAQNPALAGLQTDALLFSTAALPTQSRRNG